MSRDYKDEYKKFQGTKVQKKKRADRNRIRRRAMALGKVRKGDGKDIHHTGNHEGNGKTVIMDRSKNRGMAEKSRLKGSKRKSK